MRDARRLRLLLNALPASMLLAACTARPGTAERYAAYAVVFDSFYVLLEKRDGRWIVARVLLTGAD